MSVLIKLKIVVLLVLVIGCTQDIKKELPENELLTEYLSLVVADLGFFKEPRISRIIGKHHFPSDDVWQVVACYQFTLPSGEQGNECEDSFRLIQLDTGKWLVTVRKQGVYRWREITSLEKASNIDIDSNSNPK